VLQQVLSVYTLMASKARPDVEAAVSQLLDMANGDANSAPVLMALAHGFLLLKQTAKARNQLKVRGGGGGRLGTPTLPLSDVQVSSPLLPPWCAALQRVSKLPYVPEDADEFERAWLALADMHIAGGKFDLAQVCVCVCVCGRSDLRVACARQQLARQHRMPRHTRVHRSCARAA
jgi:tetratricopeptide repeat protein 21B